MVPEILGVQVDEQYNTERPEEYVSLKQKVQEKAEQKVSVKKKKEKVGSESSVKRMEM